MATLAIGGFASASVPAEPTRIANNARMALGAITVTGTHLAWEGVAASDDDSEIFLADAALPVAQSIGLCPLTNPCQLTDDAADDVAPLRSERWVVWQRKDLPASDRSLWFSDGIQVAAVPGSATPGYYGNSVSVSGSRVVWRGADDAGTAGIFQADLAQPLANGPASLCPLANPCRIATANAPSGEDWGPAIDGARVVWSTRPAAGEDMEIHSFDATQPADTLLLTCPLSNPCLLTANDRGDTAPIVSGSLIAWAQCEDQSCFSTGPDRVLFSDGAETLEVISDWANRPRATDGTRIAWTATLSLVMLLDTTKPIDVAPLAFPRNCPLSNPCYLDATGDVQMARRWLLSSNEMDLPGPIALRLFDLRRPLDPRPFTACPGTNPCVLREGVEGQTALSHEAIAWLECPPAAGGCAYPYSGNFDLYIVPEPSGAGAASAAIAALVATAHRRRARVHANRRV